MFLTLLPYKLYFILSPNLGQLDVNIRKVSVARSNSAVKAGMACYPMTSKPRGLALIVEICEYENDVHEPRVGSQVCGRIKFAFVARHQ